jgi:ATP-dependent DNA helicase PIF1
MLTSNLWTKRGLVNRSMGTVFDLSWDPGLDPFSTFLTVLLIKFDDYSGLDFPRLLPGIILVFPTTHSYNYKGVSCSWTQFPLWLTYTITVHKSQGLTLSKVVLNLDQKEHCLGLSYVAVLRVKMLQGLIFERPFDFDCFASMNLIMAHDQDIDFNYRNKQLV